MIKKGKMMARPSILNKLVDLAQQKTDVAARNLALLNVSTLEAEHKLRLLLTYRDDYYSRFQKSAGTGVDQAAWRNFHAFMARLDSAITDQRDAVTDSKRGVQTGQHEWRTEQQRLKSYDTLAQRNQRTEATRSARREQREQDEHTTNAFNNKTSA